MQTLERVGDVVDAPAPAAHEAAPGVELRDTVVAAVGDVGVPGRVDRDVVGVHELFPGPGRPVSGKTRLHRRQPRGERCFVALGRWKG